ncbi:hypothetical protein K469DRAFT_112325 [Zopfia rhizophila CBS 207.26]|uniref:Zn(2)-C6 fungal-type domain-containing protein n=1 Tax=Zopfia rhizophila CBS 207.26 TaxID=1314779 RepID=A0A6A6E692_9PEZI|nr:hypothetical protein K469DRAFT_112325 [Zopfia rhizophila CBS 207.26]
MGEGRPRQRKFAPRSRQGCLTCRTRRKRCDGKHPECQNCIRLNMKCEWQTPRQITAESPVRSATQTLGSPLRASIDPWEGAIAGNEVAERKQLLNYYVEAFVPSISVATTPSSNFYTSLYVPMAFESEGVLDVIIAVSSSQLAKRATDHDRARYLQDVTSKHQAKCHAFLRDRISPSGEPLKDTYQVIGVTMLLVGLEALNGTKNTKWISQLRCVRKILHAAYQENGAMTSWELESLRRHFTYHDAMASLVSGLSKPEPSTPVERDSIELLTPATFSTIDPLMGISYYLCSLIRRIQYVTSPTPAFPHISEAAFRAIEREIRQWKYESPLSSSNIDLPIALDLIALAESYRLAALIQLYRHSENHKALLPSCASRAMQFISRIPAGSPAESGLVYPIFLVGAELESETDISKCFQRLAVIQKRHKYENVSNVEKVLQEVWRPVLDGGKRRDWEDVLREWEWSISLS